jgi:hypothetical protein
MLGFYAISEAPISDLGQQAIYASAQVEAYAEVSSFANVFYDVYGNIVAYADVTAYPNTVYWDYASINGVADVTALAQNVSNAVANIYGEATVGAYANTTFSFTADIDGIADVTADYIRIRLADASITGFATVTVISDNVYYGEAQVNGYAYVTAISNEIYSGYGIINANATITANGNIVGEGWTPVVPGAETWSDITPSSDIWVSSATSVDEWENITTQNLNNGGDYKSFGLTEYPEIYNVSVDKNTTALVMNGTNVNNLYNTSSSGIVSWGSDNASFQPISYTLNQNNGSINSDSLWLSYYKNDTARSNDIVYANEQFNVDAYWVSFINILIGNSSPPSLYDKNQNITSSNIYSAQLEYQLYNVTNIGSQYFAVGYKYSYSTYEVTPFVLKSTDAINWNEIPSIGDLPEYSYYVALNSGSNYAFAGHANDTFPYQTFFASSTNGNTFTLEDNIVPSANGYTGIYGDKYIVISNQYNPYYIYTSDDGKTWTQTDVSSVFNSGTRIHNIIWDGTQYIAAGDIYNDSIISTSADGITWTSPEIIYTSSSPNVITYTSIAYSGSEYLFILATFNTINSNKSLIPFTSSDLVSWTQQSNISNGSGLGAYSLIYANGKYVFILNPLGGVSEAIMSSADGITWTRSNISSFACQLSQIIWSGTEYIAVGINNLYDKHQPFIITSSDAITWTVSNISTKPVLLKNTASASEVIVPAQGVVVLCSNVGLYYPDRSLYTSYGLSTEQIDTIMGAAVSPLNITNITDTSNLTWIKRSYVLTPYTETGSLYPSVAQEIWYAINNTNEPITSIPTITYADVFDAQTVSLTSWSGVNLDAPFNNLIPGSNIWTATNPSVDTWLRQG